jgi:hypothetical protein
MAIQRAKHTGFVADAAAGNWTKLITGSDEINGCAVQNRESVSCYVIVASAAPVAGTQPGELEIPAAPAYYDFDYMPGAGYDVYIRHEAASGKVSLITW